MYEREMDELGLVGFDRWCVRHRLMVWRKKCCITLSWDDPDDAWAVAEELRSAALRNGKGKIVDKGFWDDANTIMSQVDAYRREEAEHENDRAATRRDLRP